MHRCHELLHVRRFAALALVAAAVLLPTNRTRAGLGTMFIDNPCPSISAASGAYAFQASFVGLPNCESLCKKATASCKKAVNAAASCQLAFASDWTAFDSAVDCDGLEGADKKACKAGWSADLKAWRASIKHDRDAALTGLLRCDNLLQNANDGCLRQCSGI